MITAALLPAFLSALTAFVDSTSWEIARAAELASWIGSSCAKSSKAASTTEVAGGGGSGHDFLSLDVRASHKAKGSCSHDPRIGLESCFCDQ